MRNVLVYLAEIVVRKEQSVSGLVIVPSSFENTFIERTNRRIAFPTEERARCAALLADAIQSATCAYLAGVTLCGLAINAVFHVRWIDPFAALVAIPIICIEARRSLRGDACQCL